jgi:hypothetical protein
VHAERRQALRDESPDASEPDDAGSLLVELDAGVLAALPLAGPQRCRRRWNVPRGREQKSYGQLGGADDVRLWRIDHHDARLRGCPDVDVVQAHTGASDDLELPSRRENLGVNLGRAANEDRVDV